MIWTWTLQDFEDKRIPGKTAGKVNTAYASFHDHIKIATKLGNTQPVEQFED